MLTVQLHEQVDDSLLRFAVILARYHGQYIFCQHRERNTLEMPGGHREPGESILQAARRELQEETGAVAFTLSPVCCYSVTGPTRAQPEGGQSFGLLCVADVTVLGALDSEIARIILMDTLPERMTYPFIQPLLFAECQRRGLA
ncbi:MAG: NUDIX domain-containing protein [Aristaeellaceae bacterium]